jgi:hypothetical protein
MDHALYSPSICTGKEVVMGFLATIFEKLGFGPSAAQAAPQAAPTTPAASTAITAIDVLAKLEELAAKHKEKLNWKVSIVDLLKLLGIDSSLNARKGIGHRTRMSR